MNNFLSNLVKCLEFLAVNNNHLPLEQAWNTPPKLVVPAADIPGPSDPVGTINYRKTFDGEFCQINGILSYCAPEKVTETHQDLWTRLPLAEKSKFSQSVTMAATIMRNYLESLRPHGILEQEGFPAEFYQVHLGPSEGATVGKQNYLSSGESFVTCLKSGLIKCPPQLLTQSILHEFIHQSSFHRYTAQTGRITYEGTPVHAGTFVRHEFEIGLHHETIHQYYLYDLKMSDWLELVEKVVFAQRQLQAGITDSLIVASPKVMAMLSIFKQKYGKHWAIKTLEYFLGEGEGLYALTSLKIDTHEVRHTKINEVLTDFIALMLHCRNPFRPDGYELEGFKYSGWVKKEYLQALWTLADMYLELREDQERLTMLIAVHKTLETKDLGFLKRMLAYLECHPTDEQLLDAQFS